jgi:hypothetical protein
MKDSILQKKTRISYINKSYFLRYEEKYSYFQRNRTVVTVSGKAGLPTDLDFLGILISLKMSWDFFAMFVPTLAFAEFPDIPTERIPKQ